MGKEVQRHAVRVTKKRVEVIKKEVAQYFDANGYLSYSAGRKMFVILGTNSPAKGLVECPECGLGQLMVIRSAKTGKRFLGCSNYYGGCTASSPLLQRARLRMIKAPCAECGWPTTLFRYSRNESWSRQCSNVSCRSRGGAAPARQGPDR